MRPYPISLASFRPTAAQAVGRGAYRGLLAGAALAVGGGLAALVTAEAGWLAVGVVLLFGGTAIGAVLGAATGRDAGVDADDLGLHRVPGYPPAWPPPLAPWGRIADIRAERRRSRTGVVVYLDTGVVQRLAAPYDGPLLSHDPQFESKLFTLRNLWETHRSWGTR
ncbi:MAG TPA: hypothetical protein VFE14_13115 [Micromonosporaceae bacterium]|nr:hypothetical protein [Micromonosporaceae bacterium]